ncbi:MAG: L-serine dehydratase, alpha subunit [Oscillospiraceae bacterium]|nr:L-serine dehydratase, alpha subunit [Oscillospiraceae bacterium]
MFHSMEDMLHAAATRPVWEAVLEDDCNERGTDRTESWSRMEQLWQAMRDSAADYDPARQSSSGLVGGDGGKMEAVSTTICGGLVQAVIATALKVGESNACMGRVVAAPTAGSSGVLPAVLIPLQGGDRLTDDDMVRALYTAAGFGQVIAARASIAGAEGGCQAEIGSASGMAAAALVQLRGGNSQQMADACAMALQNLMGLICDPVAGLVEVPCVKRNVIGAMNALSAAEMALAGIGSPIPCDEVIDALRAVSDSMPAALRETGAGGLAATPTGRNIAARLRNH